MFKDSGKPNISRIFKKEKEQKIPVVCFTEEVLAKFKAYVDNCEKEIGWLALVKKDNLGRYIVYDTLLPHQNVSAVTTDLMESGLQEIGEYLMINRPDEFNNVRCWCHSHVNMQVFPSGTDEETFEQFYENCEYFIRVICNKKSDIRVDFVDIEKEIRYDNINWFIMLSEETEKLTNEKNKLLEEVNEIVKVKEDEIKKIEKALDEHRNDIYENIKDEIKKSIKEKVDDSTKYNTKGPNNKKYSNYYGNDYYSNGSYYSDYYLNERYEEEKKKKEEEYEDYYEDYDEIDFAYQIWYNMTEEEKEEALEYSMAQFLNEEGVYVNPIELISKEEYVKALEASTVKELKELFKNKKFTKHYKESDWDDMLEELDIYGLSNIIEYLFS